MKLIPKCDRVLCQLYSWQLDEEMRSSMGGQSLPMDANNCIAFYDRHYDGIVNQIVGAEGDSGELHGVYFIEHEARHKRAKMHIAFDEIGRGKLLMDSYKKVIDYVFHELHVDSIFAEVQGNNEQVKTFIQKSGWKQICSIPEYFVTSKGVVECCVFRLKLQDRSL